MHLKLAAQLSCLIKADHIPQCKSSMENVLLMISCSLRGIFSSLTYS